MSHEQNGGQDQNIRTVLEPSEYVQSSNTWKQL